MNQEPTSDLDQITKALVEQQQKQAQLIEALAQCEDRWEDRLNDLRREIIALGTQNTKALQKVGQRLENERAHRHEVKRELAKLQESGGQPSQSDRSTAEALEAYQDRLETTEHELSNLKLMLKRLTAALDQSKPASDAQKQRQEALESVQQSHETRLQKFGQRVDKLSHAVNQFRDQLVTEESQHGEMLPALRATLEANQEQLSQLLKRTKQNDRTLQLVSAHQEEMAERIAEMNQEWLERIAALEASLKKRSAPQLAHSVATQTASGDLEAPDSQRRASTVVVVKGSKGPFPGNRLDDALPAAPSLNVLPKVEHPDEETSEATERLLNRQLDRYEAEDRWRLRFRVLLALTLALLGVAVAWQYWG